MDNDILKELADAHGKTIAQVYIIYDHKCVYIAQCFKNRIELSGFIRNQLV
jgi:diketogulonate reductase-like aldo/keto reductase